MAAMGKSEAMVITTSWYMGLKSGLVSVGLLEPGVVLDTFINQLTHPGLGQ